MMEKTEEAGLHRPRKVETEIRFFGLQRAGNHAVIFWILELLEGNYAFFNNVWPNDPYMSPPDIMSGDQDDLDYSILSFEDRYLPLVARFSKVKYPTKPKVEVVINVLLMRDPFNMFASRLKSSVVSAEHTLYSTGLNPVQLYIHYSREYSGQTNFLGQSLIRISYNEWRNNENYRAYICSMLGLKFKPITQDTIPDYGGGSSFQGHGEELSARQLDTGGRWRHYLNDPSYRAFFKNREIIDFAFRTFKFEVDLKNWVTESLLPDSSKLRQLTDSFSINIVARLSMILRSTRDFFVSLYRV